MNMEHQFVAVTTQKGPLFDLPAFKERIKTLEPGELVDLFDALVHGVQSMQGIMNRPRVTEASMTAISGVMDELSGAYSAIVHEVESRQVTAANAEQFCQIVAGYEVQCEGEALEIASIAIKYARASAI